MFDDEFFVEVKNELSYAKNFKKIVVESRFPQLPHYSSLGRVYNINYYSYAYRYNKYKTCLSLPSRIKPSLISFVILFTF